MSRRPHDPFAPLVAPRVVRAPHPEESSVDDEPATPVDLGTSEGEALTGDAALRPPAPEPATTRRPSTPARAPESPLKPARGRRARRAAKEQPSALDEALARLDEASP